MQSVCICSCIGVAHYSHSSCFGHSSSDARELLRIAKQIRMAWNILKNLKKQRKSDSVPLLEDARSIWKYLEFLQQQVRDPCIQEQKANNLSQGSTCKFKLKHPKTASLTSWCFVSRVFSEAQCKPCPHIPRIKETIRTDGWISDVLKEKQLSSNINLPMYTVYLRKYTQLYTYMQELMEGEPRRFQHFQNLVIDMHVDASSFQKVLASGETCFPRHKLRMENLIFAVAQNPLIG